MCRIGDTDRDVILNRVKNLDRSRGRNGRDPSASPQDDIAIQRHRNVFAILAIALFCCSLIIAGFSYQPALPGRKLSFPADHASHPNYKTEWWYYTGHLTTESGSRYGYQLTFFRFGVRDRQKNSVQQKPLFTDLYMAHFALSDIDRKEFFFRERISRGFGGKAGAETDRYLVWNEDWKARLEGNVHVIEASDPRHAVRLRLSMVKPPVLHGLNGLSRKGKGEGRASYYYSLTRMKTEGEITTGGRTQQVRGLSWMDHEFGSDQLGETQVGWDWFSIQLENGTELMLYLIRHKDGSVDPYSSGTLVRPDGTTRHLLLSDFQITVLERWNSPKSSATYPMKWKVAIPTEELELNILPHFPNQELITNRSTRVTYWEGAVRIDGSMRNKPVGGSGYVEMTGYGGRVNI
jgi:predicted secreted hydrolase